MAVVFWGSLLTLTGLPGFRFVCWPPPTQKYVSNRPKMRNRIPANPVGKNGGEKPYVWVLLLMLCVAFSADFLANGLPLHAVKQGHSPLSRSGKKTGGLGPVGR